EALRTARGDVSPRDGLFKVVT
ncbi:MAG: hypothetical protein QOJ72_2808, partial [Nocardioidaceae bacterium]|nr:hypothetical protein [Nocardioidaceae bacterium]